MSPFPGDNYVHAGSRRSVTDVAGVPDFEIQHTVFQYTLDHWSGTVDFVSIHSRSLV